MGGSDRRYPCAWWSRVSVSGDLVSVFQVISCQCFRWSWTHFATSCSPVPSRALTSSTLTFCVAWCCISLRRVNDSNSNLVIDPCRSLCGGITQEPCRSLCGGITHELHTAIKHANSDRVKIPRRLVERPWYKVEKFKFFVTFLKGQRKIEVKTKHIFSQLHQHYQIPTGHTGGE